jgi:NAD(P)-dependent dehydrogenase (short-subunit alcohol dehydrogenase family)
LTTDFKGKHVLVTGASRGVGYQACKLFLKAGAEVIGTARDPERLAKAAKELQALGQFMPVAADLELDHAAQFIAAAVGKQWQSLDLLVNNAGAQVWKGGWDQEGPEALEKLLKVNVVAPHQLTMALLPLLKKGREPRIINVASGAGTFQALSAGSGGPGYALSKYSLNGLTLLWAAELRGSVAVNSVDPGWLKTDMGGPQAPGEPEDGGCRIFDVASKPFLLTGKFIHDQEQDF